MRSYRTAYSSTHKQNLEYEASQLRQQMCAYQSCQLVLYQHFLMSSHSLVVARGSVRSDDKVNTLNLRRRFRGELVYVSVSVTASMWCPCVCVCVFFLEGVH